MEDNEDSRSKLVNVCEIFASVVSYAEVVFEPQRLNREALVWLHLDHPYVMPFLGICYDFNDSNMPSLVSPYCPNRDIVRYLRHTADPFYSISLYLVGSLHETSSVTPTYFAELH